MLNAAQRTEMLQINRARPKSCEKREFQGWWERKDESKNQSPQIVSHARTQGHRHSRIPGLSSTPTRPSKLDFRPAHLSISKSRWRGNSALISTRIFKIRDL